MGTVPAVLPSLPYKHTSPPPMCFLMYQFGNLLLLFPHPPPLLSLLSCLPVSKAMLPTRRDLGICSLL